MATKPEFSFGDELVAKGYDSVLVPLMFDPWAEALLRNSDAWEGQAVLDLAAGTGIVTQKMAKAVGPHGRVVAADINPEMLNLARARNRGTDNVTYVESPAEPLAMESDSMDTVVCQQGFQFFPNKIAAAEEIYRVLHNGGTTMISTWCSVDECQIFGHLCEALSKVGEAELSNMIRVPFDYMPANELHEAFERAGFVEVIIEQHRLPFALERGVEQAIEVLYASPIGPKVRALPEDRRVRLHETFAHELQRYHGMDNMGDLVSNVLTARRIG